MVNKWLSGLALMTVIVLAGYEYWKDLQMSQRIDMFMSKGPRFTAADGQALCERIQKLEPNPQPCAYLPKP